MVLGHPGAAGQGAAVGPREVVHHARPQFLRSESVEDVGDGAGHRHRAVQRHVRLREQVTHDEGDQERRRVVAVVQPDDAVFIDFAAGFLPGRIVNDPIHQRPVAVVGLQTWWREAVGMFGLRVRGTADPGAKPGQNRPEPFLQVTGETPDRPSKIDVDPVEVLTSYHRSVSDHADLQIPELVNAEAVLPR